MMTTEKLLKKSSTVLFFDMGEGSHVTPKNTTHMTSAPIVVTGVHMDLTDALKETVRTKVERLLRHNPRIIRVHVELVHTRCSDHSREFGAQIRLEIPGPDIATPVPNVTTCVALETWAAVGPSISFCRSPRISMWRKRLLCISSKTCPIKAV